MMEDTANAFVETFEIEGAASGPLAGLTVAIKDIYDIEGRVTGCGSPDWARTHSPAEAHAAPVAAVLAAGGKIVGKSHTDEIAYSLMGVNAHYGTPVNTAAPDRVPGGSSSGSVAAVAAGLADIGLGSDTGGSVRMPAGFCGVYGLRTTHGSIAMDGTMPLAPSFDTVGWFAKTPDLMRSAAEAFGLPDADVAPKRLLMPVDIWARTGAQTVAAMAPALARLEARYGAAIPVLIAPEGLDTWREVFKVCQAAEAWQSHGAWIEENAPAFGPGVSDRFEIASKVTAHAWALARKDRERIVGHLMDLLAGGEAVMVLPTGPGPAPKREADEAGLDGFRTRALEMLCLSGLAGLPQLSMPAGTVEGGPVGLSVMGARGTDRALLAMA